MALKSGFYRENAIVVLGVLLPLVLVMVFALARVVSDAVVPPPAYRAVYADVSGTYGGKFHFNVDAGQHLAVTYEGIHYAGPARHKPVPVTLVVFVNNLKTGTVERHEYTVPDAYVGGVVPVPTPGIKMQIISQSLSAPDGYRYHAEDSYSYGGFFPDIFGFGYSRHYGDYHTISRGGRVFPVTIGKAYGRVDFIGWASKE